MNKIKSPLKPKVWHEYTPRTDRLSGAGRKRKRMEEILELTEQRREARKARLDPDRPQSKTPRGRQSLKPTKVWS